MYKGARVPVARSLAISSIVSRSQSCSPERRRAVDLSFRSTFLRLPPTAPSAWGNRRRTLSVPSLCSTRSKLKLLPTPVHPYPSTN